MYQIYYVINYGMDLIEAFIATFILFYISMFLNKHIPEEKQIPKSLHRLSSAIISLIVLGIAFGIRLIVSIIGSFTVTIDETIHKMILVLNTDALIFAIMVTIFYLIHRTFIIQKKIVREETSILDEINPNPFNKIFTIFIILSWIISIIFVSIPLLGIRMENPDIFTLGIIWASFTVGFDILLTILINRIRPIDKRIPKQILNYSMFAGGLISFGIWSIQLVIVELYLNRVFGLMLFTQDIRVLFGVVSVIYGIIFFVALKYKFLPLAEEKSKLNIRNALEILTRKSNEDLSVIGNHVILDVNDLTTYFYTEEGTVRAVEGVSFKVYEGETLGLVGETGCGKSVTGLSILQLIRPPGKINKGSITFGGENLLSKPESEMLKYRGKDITMIFQDPLNSLNPVFKIGKQISEVFLLHMENELLVEASKSPDKNVLGVAREWSIDLLRELNIPYPHVIIDFYPHELSGGMRQRVQIAMALACAPKLLIADEPTTALDVTIQNQILKLMKDLRKKYNTTILFITHDLGIISKMCNRVAVMYCGSIVEYGDIKKIFIKPYHPYTRGLIASVPLMRKRQNQLEVIPGMVPNLIYPPAGCKFHPRCRYCFEPCDSKIPIRVEIEPEYFVACHLYDPEYSKLAKITIEKIENSQNN
ncbi:MAG: ABC transporter ATP-binding protein [Candidatus Thorarchaeota archaeon]